MKIHQLGLYIRNTKYIRKIINKFISVLKSSYFFLRALKIYILLTSKSDLIIIALVEHLGDIVAAEPILAFLKSKYPDKKIVWLVRKEYIPLLKYHKHLHKIFIVSCLKELYYLKKLNLKFYDLHVSNKICHQTGFKYLNNKSVHTDNYFHIGNLLTAFSKAANIGYIPNVKPIIYHKKKENPSLNYYKPYIIIHTLSNDEQRNWNKNGWIKIIDFISNNYPLNIIEIGTNRLFPKDDNDNLIYLNKISIYDTIELINNCIFFIGVESGPAHIAHALDKKMIVLKGKFHIFDDYMPYSAWKGKYKVIINKNRPNDIVTSEIINILSQKL